MKYANGLAVRWWWADDTITKMLEDAISSSERLVYELAVAVERAGVNKHQLMGSLLTY